MNILSGHASNTYYTDRNVELLQDFCTVMASSVKVINNKAVNIQAKKLTHYIEKLDANLRRENKPLSIAKGMRNIRNIRSHFSREIMNKTSLPDVVNLKEQMYNTIGGVCKVIARDERFLELSENKKIKHYPANLDKESAIRRLKLDNVFGKVIDLPEDTRKNSADANILVQDIALFKAALAEIAQELRQKNKDEVGLSHADLCERELPKITNSEEFAIYLSDNKKNK